MKKILMVAIIFISLVFSPTHIGAVPVSVQAGDQTLNLYFNLPTNMNTTPSSDFTDSNCIGYLGTAVKTQLIQGCRLIGKVFTDKNAAYTSAVNGIVGKTNQLTGEENSNSDEVTINGIDGIVGDFFFTYSGGTMGNLLFIGQDGNDIVFFLYQADLSYADGPQEASDSLKSFNTQGMGMFQ